MRTAQWSSTCGSFPSRGLNGLNTQHIESGSLVRRQPCRGGVRRRRKFVRLSRRVSQRPATRGEHASRSACRSVVAKMPSAPVLAADGSVVSA